MAKKNTQYQCQSCGTVVRQWAGRCFKCGAWESIIEQVVIPENKSGASGYTGTSAEGVVLLESVEASETERFKTGWDECDRVLGGGLVVGSVTLLGGDPGVGKSTLILQLLCNLGAKKHKVLYVTGEESSEQVALRAERMGLDRSACWLYSAVDIDSILSAIKKEQSKIVVIDSIQTMVLSSLQSAAGSISQVRECAMMLTHLAKQTGVSIILIGHMTKEGHVAGPRVLEHMVDTVLYLEGEQSGRYRLLRASKNRFGAVHELGVFAMMEDGMREVKHPSLLFMSKATQSASGSVVMALWEGSRSLLVELQALVDESHGQNPRRVVVGLDGQRVNMLLALLHKHAGVATHASDVFINVVGGLKVTETASDLALAMAIVSSLNNWVLPRGLMVVGECGLNGEVRPIQQGQARLQAAVKHGITVVIMPKANQLKVPKGIQCIQVAHIREAKIALSALAETQKIATAQ